MAGVRVPERLILGFDPLLGTDHYLRERAREPQRLRSRAEVLAVLRASVEAGASGFNMNAGPETASLLKEFDGRGLARPVGLYPMIPDERFFGPAVGVSPVEHAATTFRKLRSIFGKPSMRGPRGPGSSAGTRVGSEVPS